MISVNKLTLHFAGRTLFENVDAKFTSGNCYGLIGANGAGKSTFLRCLSGEQQVSSGSVSVQKGLRLSMLKQDHFEFNEVDALTTVMMGHEIMYRIMCEKDAIYAKPDFTNEDGVRAGELEAEFDQLGGWNAESDAGRLLSSLGIKEARHSYLMEELSDSEKVRVLLAQALFGEPDILLLDEPTNHLEVDSILWLEEFLDNFKNTVIVVSHDRHFLDRVCTKIADIDFQRLQLYSGNYTFWYRTSQMALKQRESSNQKKEERIKELNAFIQRFSANASKSKQATSRRAMLDKITLDDIKPSSRKYPYIAFKTERALGRQVLSIEKLTLSLDGQYVFKDLSFSVGKGERVVLCGNDVAVSSLISVLAGVREPDHGQVSWGRSVNLGYFPKENEQFFEKDLSIIDWLKQYTDDQDETFVRSFLGRMLFSGDDVHKSATVLSGGEKVRCMLAKTMLQDPNVLLLDGPTNHLDLESITALNNGLLKFDGTMLFASHDLQFVESLADRVIELDGAQAFDLNMSYEEYLEDEDRKVRRGIAI